MLRCGFYQPKCSLAIPQGDIKLSCRQASSVFSTHLEELKCEETKEMRKEGHYILTMHLWVSF